MAVWNSIRRFIPFRNNNNLKTFLFFLLFTTFIWILVKFSENYTEQITVGVRYTNIPEDKIVLPKSDSTLTMVLDGNGFKLMRFLVVTPTVPLDFQKLSEVSEHEKVLSVNNNINLLKKKMKYKGAILSANKDSLRIYTTIRDRKKVAVQLIDSSTYAPGYTLAEPIQITPDSIEVSGPKEAIDSVNYVRTNSWKQKNLDSDFTENIGLSLGNLPASLQVSSRQVRIKGTLVQLTEGRVKVPVRVINASTSTQIQIFPKSVEVYFSVPVSNYAKVQSKDFQVTADFRKANKENTFIPLQIENNSDHVRTVRLGQPQVEYVLVN